MLIMMLVAKTIMGQMVWVKMVVKQQEQALT